jgi:hypothetical protein
MIQRIQTVYLVLGALALAALGAFEMPWSSTAAATHAWFVPALAALIVLTASTAIGAVFLYERRETQRSVVVGVQVGTALLAAVLYGGLYLTAELRFTGPEGVAWGRSAVIGLPIVAYVLFLLARRGIAHDIELVRSVDRLR